MLRKIALISYVMSFLLLGSNICKADKITIDDIDSISLSSFISGNVLNISVTYIDTEDDREVYWSHNDVDYHCSINKNSGTLDKPEAGDEILSKEGTLHSSFQDIYMTIPADDAGYYKWGILECTLDVETTDIEAKKLIPLY